MESSTLFVPKFVFKTLQGHTFLDIHRIVRFESSRNISLVYVLHEPKPIRVLHKFSTIEKHATRYPCFFQCHRCHIVNTNHIVHFREKLSTLVMESWEVPISDRFREKFLAEVLVHYDYTEK